MDSLSQTKQLIQQEAAMSNAKQLIDVSRLFSSIDILLTFCQKINEHCFNHCIPAPSSSLSKKEETCLNSCMEKYMATWNTISRRYVEHLQKSNTTSQQGMGLLQ
jgi:import inner membrane translocase subunit TIM13